MKYSKVFLEAFGYEIAPVVVSSAELEARLAPVYDALHLSPGQLEALTGIVERRWWEEGYRLSDGAALAARRALEIAGRPAPSRSDALIYGGVCREYFEPATACRVAADLGISPDATVYDISNACLGVLNGIIEIANRIELGQIRAGLVVASETAREINDIMIERMCQDRSMDFFKLSLATLTGGSGAVAVLLTDGSFSRRSPAPAAGRSDPDRTPVSWPLPLGHRGVQSAAPRTSFSSSPRPTRPRCSPTASSWASAPGRPSSASSAGSRSRIDKVICHQVGASHRDTILRSLGIAIDKDFSTFPYLGNIGTVSLPLTAALAEDREVLQPGDRVAFLGIGSGLNCLMLGVEW